MQLGISRLQLGPCHAVAFDQRGQSWTIVLPGAGYSNQAPLLWYARLAALAAGRNVLVVTDAFDADRSEPLPWVEERAEATFEHVRGKDRHPLLIAKSLTSLASSFAARERLPAVWLTPLIAVGGTLAAADVLRGLRSGAEPKLLVGGTGDQTWDGAVAAALPAVEVVELPEADHGLEVPGDWVRSLSNLRTVTDAIARFANGLR